jgi:hypothetical protein
MKCGIFVLIPRGAIAEAVGETGLDVTVVVSRQALGGGRINVQFMCLLVGVGDLGKGVVDAHWRPFQHRVLDLELVLVGDLSGEVRSAPEERAD